MKATRKKKAKRKRYISRDQCSTLRMVAGNEKKFSIVIDEGIVKDWVGFGWIDLRPATAADYFKYPITK